MAALTSYEDAVGTKGMVPDRIFMRQPEGIPEEFMALAAMDAVSFAKGLAPKLSGASAGHFEPIWGEGYFGIRWVENYVWFQEMGIKPFTMNGLQGKTIPMWVEDADGKLRSGNPKIKQRTVNGQNQVLIFRRAAVKGQRKMEKRMVKGMARWVSVPRSYPGAPGRINKRHRGAPISNRGGQIAQGNGGVRWRHPGLASKFFLHNAVLLSARALDFETGPINVALPGEVI